MAKQEPAWGPPKGGPAAAGSPTPANAAFFNDPTYEPFVPRAGRSTAPPQVVTPPPVNGGPPPQQGFGGPSPAAGPPPRLQGPAPTAAVTPPPFSGMTPEEAAAKAAWMANQGPAWGSMDWADAAPAGAGSPKPPDAAFNYDATYEPFVPRRSTPPAPLPRDIAASHAPEAHDGSVTPTGPAPHSIRSEGERRPWAPKAGDTPWAERSDGIGLGFKQPGEPRRGPPPTGAPAASQTAYRMRGANGGAAANGRLAPEEFLAVPMPVPPMPQQQQAVPAYDRPPVRSSTSTNQGPVGDILGGGVYRKPPLNRPRTQPEGVPVSQMSGVPQGAASQARNAAERRGDDYGKSPLDGRSPAWTDGPVSEDGMPGMPGMPAPPMPPAYDRPPVRPSASTPVSKLSGVPQGVVSSARSAAERREERRARGF